MNKNLTEVIFILDRSGSMSGLEKETVKGFNQFLASQKEEVGEAIISCVTFNEKINEIFHRKDIKAVQPMKEEDFIPEGCTALLDAVGDTILKTVKNQKSDGDLKPDKTIFVIMTDGYENASKEFTYDKVNHLVSDTKEMHHFQYVFLGANIDSKREALKFGFNPHLAQDYKCDEQGTALNFEAAGSMVKCFRMCEEDAVDDYMDKISEKVFKKVKAHHES